MANDELKGVVDRFLFQSTDDSGFAVLIIKTHARDPITVRGHLPNIQAGQEVHLEGSWVFHPKFGKQFEAIKSITSLPTSVTGLKKYLGSGMIKGIGPAYAEKLVDYFGASILEIIELQPERLEEVPGIGAKRVERIIQSWRDQKEISNIMVFLQDKEISATYAIKIYKQYGQQSIARLRENPYRLAEDIWGIGFKTADTIAYKMGIEKNAPERIRAGIIFAITSALDNGNLYIELESLRTKTCELLELEIEAIRHVIKNALHALHEQGKIKVITHSNTHFVTLSQYYFSEKGVAHRIENLLSKPSQLSCNIEEIYTKLRVSDESAPIALNDDQQRGIMACLQNKITIITGGPGTGKTTLIRKLLETLDSQKLTYKLAAPTGRAAKRMMEGTGRHALTIHRLLEFDFATMAFTHNEQNALAVDFLIIDEASMIDIFLAHAILRAVPAYGHIVFIGDIDQLPSVGAGNFLRDLIASKRAVCIRLAQIFRQAQNSLIVVNAHKVNNGEFPVTFLPEAKRDFIIIKEDDPSQVPNHLKAIFNGTLQKYGIPAEHAMVTVPMNRGLVGTQNINHILQGMLNPDDTKPAVTRAGTTYREGDRVMQIRNNYDKNVFNGDIGIIERIDLGEDKLIHVNYDERIIVYELDELDELVLAYAISIHKSQGSEFPVIILPLFTQHFALLQRNLVYTAITRAKKLCIMIGQSKALAMALRNNKSQERITFLQEFLTSDLACL